MTRKATDQVTTIGIDIGKNSFHLIGLDGATVERAGLQSLNDGQRVEYELVPGRDGKFAAENLAVVDDPSSVA